MSSTLSAEAVPSTTDRAADGRFAKGNPGGPGNPFARQTAALRAALINGVTERDIQDILDVLLLNAKGGHLPTIKLLFAYVLGKPKPVVEPDLLDLQEMQMFQQGALPTEALETLCGQLPLDLQVQLTRFTQADNATAAVQTALHNAPAAAPPPPTPPSNAPSTDGDNGEPRRPAAVEAPSPNGEYGASKVGKREQPPSTNGEFQRPPRPPKLAGLRLVGRSSASLRWPCDDVNCTKRQENHLLEPCRRQGSAAAVRAVGGMRTFRKRNSSRSASTTHIRSATPASPGCGRADRGPARTPTAARRAPSSSTPRRATVAAAAG